jgi:hypothetical protein
MFLNIIAMLYHLGHGMAYSGVSHRIMSSVSILTWKLVKVQAVQEHRISNTVAQSVKLIDRITSVRGRIIPILEHFPPAIMYTALNVLLCTGRKPVYTNLFLYTNYVPLEQCNITVHAVFLGCRYSRAPGVPMLVVPSVCDREAMDDMAEDTTAALPGGSLDYRQLYPTMLPFMPPDEEAVLQGEQQIQVEAADPSAIRVCAQIQKPVCRD